MFLVVPNLIIPERCCDLIALYQKYNNLAGQWRDTYPLLITPREDSLNIIDPLYLKKMKNYFCNFFNNYIHRIEIVKWPPNSFQSKHFDDARESTNLSSITYLNDDYEGGQTCVPSEKICINPKVGTTFFFDGKTYQHEVTPVKNGTRYTLAVCYTNNSRKRNKNI